MKPFRAIAAVLALGVAFTGLGPAAAAPQAKITTAVSLTAPASGPYGSTIKLSGRLWRYGTTTGVNYATVQLQRTAHNKAAWATYKTAKTNADGTFAFSVVQSGAYDYRVYFTGSPVYTGAMSPVRYPITTQKVIIDSLATTNYDTGAMQAKARVFPTPPTGTTAYLQHWLAGKWQTIGSSTTAGNGVTISLTRPPSQMSYRVVVSARYPYGPGVSATKAFANLKWRPFFERPIIKTTGDGTHSFPVPDTMYVDVPATSTSYWVHLDTRTCRRVEGTLAASSFNPTPMNVTYATARYLFGTNLQPGSGLQPYGANLFGNENELTLRFGTPGGSLYVVAAQGRMLCAN